MIETNRVLLRKIEEADIEAIYEYSKEENVGINAGWKPHESNDETTRIAREMFIQKENIWGIVLKEKNQFIGTIRTN